MAGSIFVEEHKLLSHDVTFQLARVVGSYSDWRQVTSATGSDPTKGSVDQPIEYFLGEGDLVSSCSARTVKYGFEGAQILDGVAYVDFADPASAQGKAGRGLECLGVKADGTAKIYSALDGDTSAGMVEAGVKWTFGFSCAAVREGRAVDVEGSGLFDAFKYPSARIVVGVDEGYRPMLLTLRGRSHYTGLGMNDTSFLCEELGFVEAAHLDGGGTVQAAFQGSIYHDSSDKGRRRTLHSAMAIRV